MIEQPLKTPWHVWPLRVRYQETDQMGVVFHANYLNWFEIGRTEFVRALGVTYKQLEERGLYLPLTDAELSFKNAARYDDAVLIFTRVVECSPFRLAFRAEARKVDEQKWADCMQAAQQKTSWHDEPQGILLVSGLTRHVWLNHEWRPVRLENTDEHLHTLLKRLRDVGESAL